MMAMVTALPDPVLTAAELAVAAALALAVVPPPLVDDAELLQAVPANASTAAPTMSIFQPRIISTLFCRFAGLAALSVRTIRWPC
jgi:hypothetical protein